jgi:hypothetical protein
MGKRTLTRRRTLTSLHLHVFIVNGLRVLDCSRLPATAAKSPLRARRRGPASHRSSSVLMEPPLLGGSRLPAACSGVVESPLRARQRHCGRLSAACSTVAVQNSEAIRLGAPARRSSAFPVLIAYAALWSLFVVVHCAPPCGMKESKRERCVAEKER